MNLKLLDKLLKPTKYLGYSKEEIESAEERLSLKLPSVLKELYLNFGKNNIINGHHYLIPPNHLSNYSENHLVFYMENQSCGAWSIKWKFELEEQIEIFNISDEGDFKLIERNLDIFFVKNSVTCFNQYLYPYRYSTFVSNQNDSNLILDYFGKPKSVENYQDDNINYFWNSINDLLITSTFDNYPKIYIYSKNEQTINSLINNFSQRKWKKLNNETGGKDFLERLKRYDNEF